MLGRHGCPLRKTCNPIIRNPKGSSSSCPRPQASALRGGHQYEAGLTRSRHYCQLENKCSPRHRNPKKLKYYMSHVSRRLPLYVATAGVGAQGGNLDEACLAALDSKGLGLLVPVSRGISRAEDPRAAAVELKNRINAARVRGRGERVRVNTSDRSRCTAGDHPTDAAGFSNLPRRAVALFCGRGLQ